MFPKSIFVHTALNIFTSKTFNLNILNACKDSLCTRVLKILRTNLSKIYDYS